MPATKVNIVRFLSPRGGVAIMIEGAFKLSAGMRPNVNRATCSYKEFSKLGDDLDITGSIAFYFNDEAVPDLVMAEMALIDAEPIAWGQTPDSDAWIVTKYRLLFADKRRRFQKPFGGRLVVGLLNPSTEGPPSDDAQNKQERKSVSALMGLCLGAMGESAAIPAGVDEAEPPRDLKWFGSHAPTEMAKLLELANASMILQPDGTMEIQMIGEGAEPKIPEGRALPVTTLGGVDARGRAVVFTSYPTQQVVVLTEKDLPDGSDGLPGQPTAPAWQVVYYDKDGKWKLIDESKTFGADAIKEMNDHFPKTKESVDQYGCYRYIRLDPDLFDPVISPILRKVFADPAFYADVELPPEIDLQMKAKIAVQDPGTRLWKNSADFVKVPVVNRVEGNILETALRMVRLKSGLSSTDDLEGNCVKLAPGDLKFRIALGDSEWDGEKGTFQPQYFHVGFARDGESAGGLQMIEDDAAAAAMSERETLVVPIAELLAVRFKDQPHNKKQLQERCRAMAGRYLKDASKPPKLMSGIGFFPFSLSGVAPEVEIDQRAVLTRFRINGWFRPTGVYMAAEARKLERAHESHPHEAKTQGRRSARGEAGSTPAVSPVSSYASPSVPTMFVVELAVDGGVDGNGERTADYTYTIKPLKGGDAMATKVPLFRQRQFPVQTKPAKFGLVFLVAEDDGAGGKNPKGGKQLYRLWDCDEVYASGTCDLDL